MKFIQKHLIGAAIFVLLILGVITFVMFIEFGGHENPNLYVPPQPGTNYLTYACQEKEGELIVTEKPIQDQINTVNIQLNYLGELVSSANQGDILLNAEKYDKSSHTNYTQQVNDLDQQYLSLENQISAIQTQYACN